MVKSAGPVRTLKMNKRFFQSAAIQDGAANEMTGNSGLQVINPDIIDSLHQTV